MRHSASRSCRIFSNYPIAIVLGASCGLSGAMGTYLYVEILVEFKGVDEQSEILGQVCKLPHVAQLVQCGRLLWGLLRLHLVSRPLSRDHGRQACRAATREGGTDNRWQVVARAVRADERRVESALLTRSAGLDGGRARAWARRRDGVVVRQLDGDGRVPKIIARAVGISPTSIDRLGLAR